MERVMIVFALGLLVLSLGLSACCGGGCTKSVSGPEPKASTTLGQELMDLQQAHEKGVLSDKQYEASKRKLLEERIKD